jgi:hypothetical protein
LYYETNYPGAKPTIRASTVPGLRAQDPVAGNGILRGGDRTPKIVVQASGDLSETKIHEWKAANPGRKRPFEGRHGNARFAKTGWWAHQGSNLRPVD